jgi:hypothetical protein
MLVVLAVLGRRALGWDHMCLELLLLLLLLDLLQQLTVPGQQLAARCRPFHAPLLLHQRLGA